MPIPDAALTEPLHAALRQLIRANHILHQQGLVDAFGHISIRHPENPAWYLIAAYDPGAPALVASRSDFIVYNVADSAPVAAFGEQPQGYSERFIHGEVYRRFKEARCVVHSHSEAVIPFTAASAVPVKPVFHMAGFLGPYGLRTFDPAGTYKDLKAKAAPPATAAPLQRKGYEADMLIKNAALGSALAANFYDGPPVVLQRKHGFTCWGHSIEQAVYRAIYVQKNCELLQKALVLSKGALEGVSYLSPEEARDCAVMNEKCEDKAWRLWVREVQVNPLYRTEEGEPEVLAVRGMGAK